MEKTVKEKIFMLSLCLFLILLLISCDYGTPGMTREPVSVKLTGGVEDAVIYSAEFIKDGFSRTLWFDSADLGSENKTFPDGSIPTGMYQVTVTGYMEGYKGDEAGAVARDVYHSEITYDVQNTLYNVQTPITAYTGNLQIGIKLPVAMIYGSSPEAVRFVIEIDGKNFASSDDGDVTITEYTPDDSGLSGGTVTIAAPALEIGNHSMRVYIENKEVGESRVGLDSFACRKGESVYRWIDLTYSSNTAENWSASVNDVVGGIIKLDVYPIYRRDAEGYYFSIPETNIIVLSGFTEYVTTLRIDWYIDGRHLEEGVDFTLEEAGAVENGSLEYRYFFRPDLCKEGYRCMTVVFYDTATSMAAGTSSATMRFEKSIRDDMP